MESLEAEIARNTSYTFSRASGPGGQHVNRVQTRVRARLDLTGLQGLSDHQGDVLRRNLGKRVTAGDELVVVVDQERSQARNREIALARLTTLVTEALRERKPRVKTRVPRRVREYRLEQKRRRARTKRLRGRVSEHE
jgi:ribosome-associated protein